MMNNDGQTLLKIQDYFCSAVINIFQCRTGDKVSLQLAFAFHVNSAAALALVVILHQQFCSGRCNLHAYNMIK